MDWKEPHVKIEGERLSIAEAMTLRVAVSMFLGLIEADKMDVDPLYAGYKQNVASILKKMSIRNGDDWPPPEPSVVSATERFLDELPEELMRARRKFPTANLSTPALVEEVGELAQARLKVRAGAWSRDRVWEEALQVAAMAIRVATEPDASLEVNYAEPEGGG